VKASKPFWASGFNFLSTLINCKKLISVVIFRVFKLIKSTISLLTLLLAFGYASAQVKPIVKSPSNSNQNQSKSSQAPAPSLPPAPRVPTGPSGFGSIQIGMSKDALEKLTLSDGVFLESPMTPYEYKYVSPVEGVDKFNAKVVTPLSTQSVSTVVSFQNDALISFHMNFEGISGGYERSLRQITEKYGPGKETNNRKEELCLYKGGANFKIIRGAISITWLDEVSVTERVQTRLTDFILNSCPSDLRYGSVGGIGSKGLTIEKLKPSSEAEKKNLF
jgi:hypothetical protein